MIDNTHTSIGAGFCRFSQIKSRLRHRNAPLCQHLNDLKFDRVAEPVLR